MKVLYLDCGMGAAGDMLMAALYELLDDRQKAEFLSKMNNMGISDLDIKPERTQKCGITGTHMQVLIGGEEEESHDHHHGEHCHEHEHTHEHGHGHCHEHGEHEHCHEHEHEHCHEHGHSHHHAHYGLSDINSAVSALDIPEAVKADVLTVYKTIAAAESHVHGEPMEHIHFHEVGSLDAIADVVGVSLLMHMLSPDKVFATPVHVGAGHVHCAHGILPVPAPATAHILEGVPIYSGHIQGELCTPTGAALLKHFVSKFGSMPVFVCEKTGYGMGKKDFEAANCVRAMLGVADESGETGKTGVAGTACGSASFEPNGEIIELSCNLDDMTPEAAGFALDKLLERGAVDAFYTPIFMKKNRPAFKLTVLCHEKVLKDIVACIFRNTTTLGIRQHTCERYTLDRSEYTVDTPVGKIRIKESKGYGVTRQKPEYDDIAAAADFTGFSFIDSDFVARHSIRTFVDEYNELAKECLEYHDEELEKIMD